MNQKVGSCLESSLVKAGMDCYVRVTGVRNNAFVEFDFSFDDPSIFLELVLPSAQFEEFCLRHKVKQLTKAQEKQVDLDKLKWRYGQPGVRE